MIKRDGSEPARGECLWFDLDKYFNGKDYVGISFHMECEYQMTACRRMVSSLGSGHKHYAFSTDVSMVVLMPEEVAKRLDIPAERVSIKELLACRDLSNEKSA